MLRGAARIKTAAIPNFGIANGTTLLSICAVIKQPTRINVAVERPLVTNSIAVERPLVSNNIAVERPLSRVTQNTRIHNDCIEIMIMMALLLAINIAIATRRTTMMMTLKIVLAMLITMLANCCWRAILS